MTSACETPHVSALKSAKQTTSERLRRLVEEERRRVLDDDAAMIILCFSFYKTAD